MPDQNPLYARAWWDRTLDATSAKLTGLENLGITVDGPLTWTDPDNIQIRATRHPNGQAVTIELPDNQEPFKKWTIPAGWLTT